MYFFLIFIFFLTKAKSFIIRPDLYARNMYGRREYVWRKGYKDLSTLSQSPEIEKNKITSEQFKEYIQNFKYLIPDGMQFNCNFGNTMYNFLQLPINEIEKDEHLSKSGKNSNGAYGYWTPDSTDDDDKEFLRTCLSTHAYQPFDYHVTKDNEYTEKNIILGPSCLDDEIYDVKNNICEPCPSGTTPDWSSSIYWNRKFKSLALDTSDCHESVPDSLNILKTYIGLNQDIQTIYCKRLTQIDWYDLNGGNPDSSIYKSISNKHLLKCLFKSCADDVGNIFEKFDFDPWTLEKHPGLPNLLVPIECKEEKDLSTFIQECSRCNMQESTCDQKYKDTDTDKCQKEEPGKTTVGILAINDIDYTYNISISPDDDETRYHLDVSNVVFEVITNGEYCEHAIQKFSITNDIPYIECEPQNDTSINVFVEKKYIETNNKITIRNSDYPVDHLFTLNTKSPEIYYDNRIIWKIDPDATLMRFTSMNIIGSWVQIQDNMNVYYLDEKYDLIFVLGINFVNDHTDNDKNWAALTVVEINSDQHTRTRYLTGYLNKEIEEIHSVGLITSKSLTAKNDPAIIIACVKRQGRYHIWLTNEKGFPIDVGHDQSPGSRFFNFDFKWHKFSYSAVEMNYENYLLLAVVDEDTQEVYIFDGYMHNDEIICIYNEKIHKDGECEGTNDKILDMQWTDDKHLVLMTPNGLYLYNPERVNRHLINEKVPPREKTSKPGNKYSIVESYEENTDLNETYMIKRVEQINCSIGKYQDEADQPQCKNCEQGKYQDEIGQNNCKDCIMGQYNADEGQIECSNCFPGKYSDIEGSEECKNCEVGYFNLQNNSVSCKLCDERNLCQIPGMYFPWTICTGESDEWVGQSSYLHYACCSTEYQSSTFNASQHNILNWKSYDELYCVHEWEHDTTLLNFNSTKLNNVSNCYMTEKQPLYLELKECCPDYSYVKKCSNDSYDQNCSTAMNLSEIGDKLYCVNIYDTKDVRPEEFIDYQDDPESCFITNEIKKDYIDVFMQEFESCCSNITDETFLSWNISDESVNCIYEYNYYDTNGYIINTSNIDSYQPKSCYFSKDMVIPSTNTSYYITNKSWIINPDYTINRIHSDNKIYHIEEAFNVSGHSKIYGVESSGYNGYFHEDIFYDVEAWDIEAIKINMNGGTYSESEGDALLWCRHEFQIDVNSSEIDLNPIYVYNNTNSTNATEYILPEYILSTKKSEFVYCNSFYPFVADNRCTSITDCPKWSWWPPQVEESGFVNTDPCICNGTWQYGGFCTYKHNVNNDLNEEVWHDDIEQIYYDKTETYFGKCIEQSLFALDTFDSTPRQDIWWKETYEKSCWCGTTFCNPMDGYRDMNMHHLFNYTLPENPRFVTLVGFCESENIDNPCGYNIIDNYKDLNDLFEENENCTNAKDTICGIVDRASYHTSQKDQKNLYSIYDEYGDISGGVFDCVYKDNTMPNDFMLLDTNGIEVDGYFMHDADFEIVPNGAPKYCKCGKTLCNFGQFCKYDESLNIGICGASRNEVQTNFDILTIDTECPLINSSNKERIVTLSKKISEKCKCNNNICSKGQYCFEDGCRECLCNTDEYEFTNNDEKEITCKTRTVCNPGQKISSYGTKTSDTRCEDCIKGQTWSNMHNSRLCLNCNDCQPYGIKEECTIHHDAVCNAHCPSGKDPINNTCIESCGENQHVTEIGTCIDYCQPGTFFNKTDCHDCPENTYTSTVGNLVCLDQLICNMNSHYWNVAPSKNTRGECIVRSECQCGIYNKTDFSDNVCIVYQIINTTEILKKTNIKNITKNHLKRLNHATNTKYILECQKIKKEEHLHKYLSYIPKLTVQDFVEIEFNGTTLRVYKHIFGNSDLSTETSKIFIYTKEEGVTVTTTNHNCQQKYNTTYCEKI